MIFFLILFQYFSFEENKKRMPQMFCAFCAGLDPPDYLTIDVRNSELLCIAILFVTIQRFNAPLLYLITVIFNKWSVHNLRV